MKLHHLGIATNNFDKCEKFLKTLFTIESKNGPIYDDALKANLLLFKIKEGTYIELVEGDSVKSIINKGFSLYHQCYEVKDIERTIYKFKESGANLIIKPTPAVLFKNRLVCFMLTPLGIIELLEGS